MDFQSGKSFGKLRLRAFQPYHQILCMSKHVKDVEDRSNTHKGCNAMYVEDVEDIKTSHNRCLLKYSGGSRIFPRGGANSPKCYYFSIFCRKLHENERIWTPRGGARPWCPPLDPPMKYVEDVEDRSNTHKGCNAMYVEDVKDIKTSHNLRRLRHT